MSNPFDIIFKQNLTLPVTLIQIGASGGQEVELFSEVGVTSAVLIEPLDFPYSVLHEKVASHAGFFPCKALITSKNEQSVSFYVASNSGMSSSILEPKKHLNLYPDVTFPEKLSLVGYRLDYLIDDLFRKNFINFASADMLYLDVQGAELIVLKSAGQLLENASYVWTEVGSGGGYEHAAKYTEIINYLDFYNFQMIYFECAFEGFGDALFVKKSAI